jgi:hypothetical protein
MAERSFRFKPSTAIGGWSIGLIVVVPILFTLGSSLTDTLYASVSAGSTILADIAARPFLALSMLAGMAAGVAGFITGLVALIKHKEKALLVYLSTVIGGILTLYLIAELAFPH